MVLTSLSRFLWSSLTVRWEVCGYAYVLCVTGIVHCRRDSSCMIIIVSVFMVLAGQYIKITTQTLHLQNVSLEPRCSSLDLSTSHLAAAAAFSSKSCLFLLQIEFVVSLERLQIDWAVFALYLLRPHWTPLIWRAPLFAWHRFSTVFEEALAGICAASCSRWDTLRSLSMIDISRLSSSEANFRNRLHDLSTL